MKDLLKSIGAPEFLSRHWGKLLVGQAIVLVGLGFVLASMMGGSEEPAKPIAGQCGEDNPSGRRAHDVDLLDASAERHRHR